MSLLPYDWSEEIAVHGWRKAWTTALAHLKDAGQFQNDGAWDHDAACRALLTEKVTVSHLTRGRLTVSFPAALALDAVKHIGVSAYLGAVADITDILEQVFRYDYANGAPRTFPVESDAGCPVPGLGALWLVTWAHQPEAIFQDRRRQGRSHTRLNWPNTYFEPAAMEKPNRFTNAKLRLLSEAAQAYPWLLSNVGLHQFGSQSQQRANVETKVRLDRALSLGLYHWRKPIEHYTQGTERVALDRWTHQAIQSGALTNQGDEKWDFLSFVQGAGPDANPSTRLARVVDGLAFYRLSTSNPTWCRLIDKYLAEGGRLNSQDPCHADRMRNLEARHAEVYAQLRRVQIEDLSPPSTPASPDETAPATPRRQRIRS